MPPSTPSLCIVQVIYNLVVARIPVRPSPPPALLHQANLIALWGKFWLDREIAIIKASTTLRSNDKTFKDANLANVAPSVGAPVGASEEIPLFTPVAASVKWVYLRKSAGRTRS